MPGVPAYVRSSERHERGRQSLCNTQKSQNTAVVLQGVHEVFEGEPGKLWKEGEPHKSKMVFIGKNLDRKILMGGLEGCLA